jgi:cytidine deaminase
MPVKTLDSFLLGSFTSFSDLNSIEKELVLGIWAVAQNAYIPRSNFPVGATILAHNEAGETKIFSGCNVENRFFAPTICAERNAATTAVAQGYRKFLMVALVCLKYQGPGASSCGLCRQFMTEFGRDTVVLEMADKDSNVQKYLVGDLLPAATAGATQYKDLSLQLRAVVNRLTSCYHGLMRLTRRRDDLLSSPPPIVKVVSNISPVSWTIPIRLTL